MKRFVKWIGALIVFVAGCFLASSARRAKQRSDAITSREVHELAKAKRSNLEKAEKLGKKAEVKFRRAAELKEAAEKRADQLEKADEKGLADRMRRFNNSL